MTTDDIRILKTGTCPSLSGKSKLTYEIGAGPASEICMRITKNSGAGMFGKGWVELEGIHKLVNDKPITSTTLAPLFKGGSANSAGFLLAVMKYEGLMQESGRAYERLDGKAFFAEIKTLMGTPGRPPRSQRRRRPRARSRPSTSRRCTGHWSRRHASLPRSRPSADRFDDRLPQNRRRR